MAFNRRFFTLNRHNFNQNNGNLITILSTFRIPISKNRRPNKYASYRFILNIPCLLLYFSLSGQYFSARLFKDEHGMTSNRISEMEQAANNEIWIATQDGISTFDGLTWTTFPDSIIFLPKAGSLKIQALKDSSVFIFGMRDESLTLAKYHNRSWTEIGLPDAFKNPPPHTRFHITAQQETGAIVIAINNHLCFYTNDKWKHIELTRFRNEHFQLNKLKFVGDSLILATNQGLYSYTEGSIRTLLPDETIHDFLWCNERQAWIVLSESWLGELHGINNFNKLHDIKGAELYSAKELINLLYKDGSIYYSRNSPIYKYTLSSKEHIPIITQHYDLDYLCHKAIFDHEGNLWCATMRGAYKINNLDTYSYNGNYLLENEVTAIREDSQGNIYLGSNLGLNILKPSGEIEQYPFPKSIMHPRIMDIAFYKGEVYLAAYGAGVVRFSNQEFHYDSINGLGTQAIDIHVHKDYLYAASKGLLFRKKENVWEQISNTTHAGMGLIRKIFINDQHSLLFTEAGAFNLNNGKIITSNEINDNNIYTCHTYHDTTFIGTANGVRAIVNDKIVTPKWASTTSQPTYSFATDSKDRLWVGTNQGIYPARAKDSYQLRKSNGLAGNEINRNAFVLLNDGQLAIGTDEGVSFYTPETPLSLPIPNIEILKPQVNNEELPSWPESLSHERNSIKFTFRSVSYFDEKQINYRVMLIGLETKWTDIPFHNQRSLLYSNLNPGKYQLTVQARIGNGNWSKAAISPSITINPAFYNRTSFRLIGSVMLILFVFAILRIRSHQLRQRNELLKKRIEEKTSELNQQNNELLKAITNLKSTQGQLIQSEKLASMGHLTAGIAHELNNPLNYIRGGAECIIKNLQELDEIFTTLKPMRNDVELLKEYKYIMDDSRQLAESILIGASKSTSIVKSLNSFTADAQNFFSFVDLAKEVETALTLLNNEIGFRITVNKLFGNLPTLECYPAKINQLIVNILLNAIQAIKDTGEITIRLYRKDVSQIAMEVTDSGEGFRAEDAHQLFEPFYTSKDTNTGLGLTIVKSIVQEHNGTVVLESKPNHGTKACVHLPINQTFHP